MLGFFITFVDYTSLSWLHLNHFTNYIIGVSFVIYILWSYFGIKYKFLYIIGDGKIKIYKGKMYKELTISSILRLERITSIGGTKTDGGIRERINIITKDEKIEIDRRLKNTNGRDLADILINRYNRKTSDITKFLKY